MKELIRACLSAQRMQRLAMVRRLVAQVRGDVVDWGKHHRAWASVRTAMRGVSEVDVVFAIAQREFGLCQVPSEVQNLLTYASGAKPRVAGEIGVRDGGCSFLFMHCLPEVEYYVGVDLAVRNRRKLISLRASRQCVKLFDGDSRSPETVERVRRCLGARRFDFLFIDGDHRYEGVRADFLSYRTLVGEGALIAFHDINQGPAKSENDSDGNLWAGGVPRFWGELKRLYRCREFIENPGQVGFGIGVIEYDSSVRIA